MGGVAKSRVLFALNWLDAQLTLVWVHSNIATEGNGLMGQLLKAGDAPFILVKLLVGAFGAYTLYRCSHLPLPRRGMRLGLTIYAALMLVHAVTGVSALGCSRPFAAVHYMTYMP